MPSEQSISRLVRGLKAGDAEAAEKLWAAYFDKVIRLARKKLGGMPRRAADEHDVALSVMKSLYVGTARGRFPALTDRDNLWRLLVVITHRKVADLIVHERRRKRGGGAVRGESAFRADDSPSQPGALEAILAQEPGPETLVQMEEEFHRLLDRLRDDLLRRIAVFKMEGYTNDEIAEKVGRARRTIARKLDIIRKTWLVDQRLR
jgi:DNA-directed RNA polymerase specialized sigma24 family protein